MKFRIGRFKKDKQKKEKPPIIEEEESAVPSGQESPPQILKPNAREEAVLIDSDASNDSLQDLNQAPPPPPSEVALGSDPLTQLASQSEGQENAFSPKPLLSSVGRSSDSFKFGRSSSVGQCLTLQDHNTLRSFIQARAVECVWQNGYGISPISLCQIEYHQFDRLFQTR